MHFFLAHCGCKNKAKTLNYFANQKKKPKYITIIRYLRTINTRPPNSGNDFFIVSFSFKCSGSAPNRGHNSPGKRTIYIL